MTLDEARAVEAVIPVEGGVLSATGADGTQYALEIPGDALLVETKIRLIPAAVSGLPFGGEQTYAAQLEPEGLFFNNFVTLTITPAQEIPLKEQIFFGYSGSGQRCDLRPAGGRFKGDQDPPAPFQRIWGDQGPARGSRNRCASAWGAALSAACKT